LKFLTQKETCKALGISLSTLKRKRKSGELQAVKVGNRIYFRFAEPDDAAPVPQPEVKPFPNMVTVAEPEPESAPETIDLENFTDSWGNKIGQPSEKFLALFGRDPGGAYDAPNPANTFIHVRQIAPRESFHHGGSRSAWPTAQPGYAQLTSEGQPTVDNDEWNKLWK
jgi:excisionase family DNA binding protein